MQEISDALALPKSRIIFVSCEIPSLAFNAYKNFTGKKKLIKYTNMTGMYDGEKNFSANTPHSAVERYVTLNVSTPMALLHDKDSLQLDRFEHSLSVLRSHLTKEFPKLIVFCEPTVSNELSHLGIVIDANSTAQYLSCIMQDYISTLTIEDLAYINNLPVKTFLKAYYKAIRNPASFKESLIANLKSSNTNNYLEFVESNPHMYGLPKLAEWVTKRKCLITGDHPVPMKGISLIGIPGVGKTKSVGYISHLLDIPAYKFNILSCLNRYVGNSEANVNQALYNIQSIGKCVVLLDEVDKVFSKTDDDGTTSRILSLLLAFMDNNTEAFWVVTGNNIDKIPPELLRKGRLNEYFYIGLPEEEGIHDYITYIFNVYKNYGFSYTKSYIKELTAFCIKHKLLFNDIVSLMEDIYIDFVTQSNSELEVVSSYYRHKEDFDRILEWSKSNAKSAM